MFEAIVLRTRPGRDCDNREMCYNGHMGIVAISRFTTMEGVRSRTCISMWL